MTRFRLQLTLASLETRFSVHLNNSATICDSLAGPLVWQQGQRNSWRKTFRCKTSRQQSHALMATATEPTSYRDVVATSMPHCSGDQLYMACCVVAVAREGANTTSTLERDRHRCTRSFRHRSCCRNTSPTGPCSGRRPTLLARRRAERHRSTAASSEVVQAQTLQLGPRDSPHFCFL